MDTNSLIAVACLAAAAASISLRGLKYQKEYAAIASGPIRQQLEEIKAEDIILKRKLAGLQGKYSQLKENFDFAEQDMGEQAAGGGNVELTPEIISNLSGLSATEILTPDFLESIGINPSLLNVQMVKGFVTNFIDGGGLKRIAAKLQTGDQAGDQAGGNKKESAADNDFNRPYL